MQETVSNISFADTFPVAIKTAEGGDSGASIFRLSSPGASAVGSRTCARPWPAIVDLGGDFRRELLEIGNEVQLVFRAAHSHFRKRNAQSGDRLVRFAEDRHSKTVAVVDRFFAVGGEAVGVNLLELAIKVGPVDDAVLRKPINSVAAEQLFAPRFALKRE